MIKWPRQKYDLFTTGPFYQVWLKVVNTAAQKVSPQVSMQSFIGCSLKVAASVLVEIRGNKVTALLHLLALTVFFHLSKGAVEGLMTGEERKKFNCRDCVSPHGARIFWFGAEFSSLFQKNFVQSASWVVARVCVGMVRGLEPDEVRPSGFLQLSHRLSASWNPADDILKFLWSRLTESYSTSTLSRQLWYWQSPNLQSFFPTLELYLQLVSEPAKMRNHCCCCFFWVFLWPILTLVLREHRWCGSSGGHQ